MYNLFLGRYYSLRPPGEDLGRRMKAIQDAGEQLHLAVLNITREKLTGISVFDTEILIAGKHC